MFMFVPLVLTEAALAYLIGTVITAVVGAGATGAGILYNKKQSEKLTGAQNQQNAFNADEAQRQRDFEVQMSNTAFQRQTADMRAAGLNPAIMYGGTGASGASTPSGSAASGSGNGGQQFDPMQLLSVAMQMGVSMQQLKEQKRVNTSEIELNKAKAEAESAKARKDSASAIYQEWLNSPEMRAIDRDTRAGSLVQIMARTDEIVSNTEVQKAVVEEVNSKTELNVTEAQYKEMLTEFQRIQNDVAARCKEYKINQESYKAQTMYWQSIGESVNADWMLKLGMTPDKFHGDWVVAAGQLAVCAARAAGNALDSVDFSAIGRGVKKAAVKAGEKIEMTADEIGEAVEKVFNQGTSSLVNPKNSPSYGLHSSQK